MIEIHSKIDNHVSDISELENFCSSLDEEIRKLEEINEIIQQLKSHDFFTEILENVKSIETLEKKLIYLRQIQQVEKIGKSLRNYLGSDNDKAFEFYKELEQFSVSTPYLISVIQNRINYSQEILKAGFYKQLENLLEEIS